MMLAHACRIIRCLVFCLAIAVLGQSASASAQAALAEPPKLTGPQLEQLVAPIALHPDPLLSQILMASTYPLEVVEASRWVKQNPGITGDAMKDAVAKQRWDESVKSLTAFPQVIEMMNAKLSWTQQLGDAFLEQQEDVLKAVQRLRAKADAQGALTTTKEQTVEKQVTPASDGGGAAAGAPVTTYVIQPTDPQVIYVPSYDPAVVYGTWPYPDYPPYSWYPPAWVPGRGLWFAAGIAAGGALWGWFDWRHHNINIDIDRYNRFNQFNQINRNQFSQANFAKWEHNSVHRRGVSYRNADVAARYGRDRRDATAREQFRGRAETGRRNLMDPGQGGGGLRADGRPGNASNLTPGNRPDRPGRGDGGRGDASNLRPANRPDRPGRGDGDRKDANLGDRRPQAKDLADRRAGGDRREIAPKGNMRQPGNRGQAAARARSMPPRAVSQPRQVTAFRGMGNAHQVRQFSSRGSYSRSFGGGGGFRGGGGGRRR